MLSVWFVPALFHAKVQELAGKFFLSILVQRVAGKVLFPQLNLNVSKLVPIFPHILKHNQKRNGSHCCGVADFGSKSCGKQIFSVPLLREKELCGNQL